ncbi:hypothetical protein DFJ74DRAFT_674195 [Hyaloraphidium curvatum]|nr:hypothetical protein DFJ74DRAFT_674195 [Hyaloraphidium curvatum]
MLHSLWVIQACEIVSATACCAGSHVRSPSRGPAVRRGTGSSTFFRRLLAVRKTFIFCTRSRGRFWPLLSVESHPSGWASEPSP